MRERDRDREKFILQVLLPWRTLINIPVAWQATKDLRMVLVSVQSSTLMSSQPHNMVDAEERRPSSLLSHAMINSSSTDNL